MTDQPNLATSPFLTAEWRNLLMLNFAVERETLEPRAPAGTIVDTYRGVAYVSMVGFLFRRTRVLGIPMLFHKSFEEVNLRFYVRRFDGESWRRGVVFIKEIVPSFLISSSARFFYNENYERCEMRHQCDEQPGTRRFEYSWRYQGEWNSLAGAAAEPEREVVAGSIEEFITDHEWGYTRQRDGGTLEYQVVHPRWPVARARECKLTCNAVSLYGSDFASALAKDPASAFAISGSAVTVYRGKNLDS